MPKITKARGPQHARARQRLATAGEAEAGQAATGSELEQPARKAVKAEWVAYAESQGVDTDGLTKGQIIEAVG